MVLLAPTLSIGARGAIHQRLIFTVLNYNGNLVIAQSI
jgi:hypothetical protein